MFKILKKLFLLSGLFFSIFMSINVMFALFYSSKYAKVNLNGKQLDEETKRHITLSANSHFFRFFNNIAPDNSVLVFYEMIGEKKYTFSLYYDGKIDTYTENQLISESEELEAISFLGSSSKLNLRIMFNNNKTTIDRNYDSFLFTGLNTITERSNKVTLMVCGFGFLKTNIDNNLIMFLKSYAKMFNKSYKYFNQNNAVGLTFEDIKSCDTVSDIISLSKGGLDFYDGVYLSLVTISTLGYGDYTPNNTLTRLLVGLESALGLFLFAIFGSFYFSLFHENIPYIKKWLRK